MTYTYATENKDMIYCEDENGNSFYFANIVNSDNTDYRKMIQSGAEIKPFSTLRSMAVGN